MTQPLAQFLTAPERPEGTMTYPELQGFLFAVACCPEPVEPDEWLALIFNEQDAGFADEDEAAAMIEAIVGVYNDIYEELLEGEPLLPDCCRILTPADANFADDASLSAWARGFLDGHEWLADIWEQAVPSELDDELGSALVMLMCFSSRELAAAFCNNGGEELGPEVLAQAAVENFEAAMSAYARIGQVIKQALAAADSIP